MYRATQSLAMLLIALIQFIKDCASEAELANLQARLETKQREKARRKAIKAPSLYGSRDIRASTYRA